MDWEFLLWGLLVGFGVGAQFVFWLVTDPTKRLPRTYSTKTGTQ
jgi:hypothetical protein